MGVPGWFSRGRTESERFDDAINASSRQQADEFAEELALVGALRELGQAGAPDPATRARIRAEIEGRIGEPLPRRRWRPRMADLAAAGIALILGLGGLTLLLSRDALPGDALYSVKRAGEVTSLGLTFGDEAKAEKHLKFAANRVTELGRMNDASPAAYETALHDFGNDVRAGVAELTELATTSGNRTRLTSLEAWAQSQARQLESERTGIPASALEDFRQARLLLDRVQQRTSALGSRLSCYQITTGTTDELGLLPARGACTQQPLSPGGSTPSSPPPPAPGTSVPPSDSPLPVRSVSSPTLSSPGTPTPTRTSAEIPHPPAPPSFPPPITAPTSPRIPTRPAPPPVVSIPPLLPGLPPIVVG
ncbi:hypothetical protein CU254_01115 [Amycolatopsis sp. AA4]|uniref:DUF5667 domain-containing protein n=1 Tax=Actinomycetes TaxID=1760 RepID=UPI0002D6948F|nr:MULTISPECIES: DUF5667 domain-containing protein [Actinomycetes]ATY09232.1 hypothetical protein CU254_01115 [Amycolatopsis sp. AA4]